LPKVIAKSPENALVGPFHIFHLPQFAHILVVKN